MNIKMINYCHSFSIRRIHRGVENSGMSLVEVVVAMGVLTLVGVALVTLVLQAVFAANSAKLRAMAIKYADEGMEVARAVRGQQTNWATFVTSCASSPATNYWVKGNSGFNCDNGILDDCTPSPPDLCSASQHVATTLPGSLFIRTVNFQANGADTVNVTVLVTWKDRGQGREVRLKTQFSRWQ
jgi:Tfp pilus assembly protein PilV